ncbi:MAG: hypothetical protein F4Y41_13225 [Gammaproteobacteria bacterium]|nr:hypothetical protein [Gammaproteobacteria bacterium]
MTTETPLELAPDAVNHDADEILESNHGIRFLSAPEAKFANVPAPTAEEIERDLRNVAPKADARVFVLRTMQARQLWLGRLPPTRPGDGVRIPGISFAHFILTGLLRRRSGTLDICLDNLARHANATVRGINSWRRKNDRWVQRAIPDGAKPLADPATTARFFLETQFPALMKLGTAIAHFDSVFAEVAAATEVAKDVRLWNPNLRYYRVHFGAIRSILYAVQASRKLDLPRPADAPQRFDLMDPGPLPARKATNTADPKPATESP